MPNAFYQKHTKYICTKNYQNRFTYVRVIARQSSDIFGTLLCTIATLRRTDTHTPATA